nr:DUF951 domain-containing protein [bacterium]
MPLSYELGDIVKTKKSHPCGGDLWKIIRVGADIKIKCTTCGRIVMMDRADFDKRLRKIVAHSGEDQHA